MKKPIYKLWWFWVLLLLVVGILGRMARTSELNVPVTPAAAVQPAQETSAEPAAESETPSPAEPSQLRAAADQIPLPKKEVLAYTASLTGKNFIKEVIVGTDNISINFFTSFKEYQTANPNSGISSQNYVDYFSAGDTINKLLMEETSRLFKQFPGTASIDMAIPYEGKTYSVSLTKGAVEDFYKVDFDRLTPDEQWRDQISAPYFNKEQRQRFIDKFVSVE